MEMRQYDRAWCVSAALAFLRKADAEEQQFFEQYKPKGFVRAQGAAHRGAVAENIYHPDEDGYISHIFAAVSQAVAGARAKEHKDWGLKRKDRRDVATDQLLFSKVFNYVNQVLGVPQPELYLRPESPGELDLANAREKAQLIPSFVVGASLLQGRPEKELAYVIGKKLTFMRPDHFVRWPTVVPTVAELKVVFLAALKLVHPKLEVKADLAQPVGQYLDAAQAPVPPQVLEQLGAVVQRFVASKGEADIHKWSNAVDLTATRAGFLICNDLDVAARLVQSRAGRGRRRRAQGQDPRPAALVDLRGVLRAARAPGPGHRPGLDRSGGSRRMANLAGRVCSSLAAVTAAAGVWLGRRVAQSARGAAGRRASGSVTARDGRARPRPSRPRSCAPPRSTAREEALAAGAAAEARHADARGRDRGAPASGSTPRPRSARQPTGARSRARERARRGGARADAAHEAERPPARAARLRALEREAPRGAGARGGARPWPGGARDPSRPRSRRRGWRRRSSVRAADQPPADGAAGAPSGSWGSPWGASRATT